jgi:hypothetical protein
LAKEAKEGIGAGGVVAVFFLLLVVGGAMLEIFRGL